MFNNEKRNNWEQDENTEQSYILNTNDTEQEYQGNDELVEDYRLENFINEDEQDQETNTSNTTLPTETRNFNNKDIDFETIIEELQEENAKLTIKYNHLSDDYKRIKQRSEEDSKRLETEAICNSARNIINIINDIEYSKKMLTTLRDTQEKHSFIQVLNSLEQKAENRLNVIGILTINPINEPYNPHTQQAVNVTNNTQYPNNYVIEVIQKGWVFNDKIIQPASVIVNVLNG